MKIGVLILALMVCLAKPGNAAVEENNKSATVDVAPIVINDEGNKTAT